jgi:hypothetical protein
MMATLLCRLEHYYLTHESSVLEQLLRSMLQLYTELIIHYPGSMIVDRRVRALWSNVEMATTDGNSQSKSQSFLKGSKGFHGIQNAAMDVPSTCIPSAAGETDSLTKTAIGLDCTARHEPTWSRPVSDSQMPACLDRILAHDNIGIDIFEVTRIFG